MTRPSQEELPVLASPPSKEDITINFQRAINTAPGADGIEYRELFQLYPTVEFLEKLYEAAWRLGIPTSWKPTRTIPIFKNGDSLIFLVTFALSHFSLLYTKFSPESSLLGSVL